MRLRDLTESKNKNYQEIQKKEEKLISKIKDITVTFSPKVKIDGKGVLKPILNSDGDDWELEFDKSKTNLPDGAKENYVTQLVSNLFFNWLENSVNGKKGQIKMDQDRDDLTYTAVINFK